MRVLLLLAALGAIAAALALSTRTPTEPPAPRRTVAPTATPAPSGTPVPPELPVAAINQQDRTSPAHRAREARVHDERPLLSHLPLERAGVRIDIAGLTPDQTMTVLSIDPGARSRTHARNVYRRALRRHGDPGGAYVLEWTR